MFFNYLENFNFNAILNRNNNEFRIRLPPFFNIIKTIQITLYIIHNLYNTD